MSKAEKLLTVINTVKPQTHITWPVYNGTDPIDAKTVQDYVTAFFKTAMLMPIPLVNLGLDICSIKTEYDDQTNHYLVIIDGTVRNFIKEEK